MTLPARLRKIGPGMLVTAAFIGPGTVTTASRAGLQHGLTLLWAVGFATLATIVLQEMSARLGIVSRTGLGESIRDGVRQPALRAVSITLVLMAILFGNSAYQTGNLTGAAQGLSLITHLPQTPWVLAVGAVVAALLWTATYRVVSNVLVALVVTMSVLFLATALLVGPDIHAIADGLFTMQVPANALGVVVGLIGTTVVPYNLFLHASAVQEHWGPEVQTSEALLESRIDTAVSILLGGLVTGAIVVTGAALSTTLASGAGSGPMAVAGMTGQLAPLLGGTTGRTLFALGLFSAGMTSAITAPLAAAYATAGILGWRADRRSVRFRAVWGGVVLVGVALAAAFGTSPAETILAAQIANGILLPVIAGYLLFAVNRPSVMREHANGIVGNIFGVACVGVATAFGIGLILKNLGLVG
jgi:manganese transport protein